jgi:hypothetical protein
MYGERRCPGSASVAMIAVIAAAALIAAGIGVVYLLDGEDTADWKERYTEEGATFSDPGLGSFIHYDFTFNDGEAVAKGTASFECVGEGAIGMLAVGETNYSAEYDGYTHSVFSEKLYHYYDVFAVPDDSDYLGTETIGTCDGNKTVDVYYDSIEKLTYYTDPDCIYKVYKTVQTDGRTSVLAGYCILCHEDIVLSEKIGTIYGTFELENAKALTVLKAWYIGESERTYIMTFDGTDEFLIVDKETGLPADCAEEEKTVLTLNGTDVDVTKWSKVHYTETVAGADNKSLIHVYTDQNDICVCIETLTGSNDSYDKARYISS